MYVNQNAHAAVNTRRITASMPWFYTGLERLGSVMLRARHADAHRDCLQFTQRHPIALWPLRR
jgi:hypothetical protein